MQTRSPHDTDVAFGSRIRLRRRQLGLSQDQLAQRAGVTFQQVQKYERGTNRVSISRALLIAQALDCRLVDLIGDLDGEAAPLRIEDETVSFLDGDEGARSLLAAFSQIQSRALRKRVLALVKAMVVEVDEAVEPA